MSVDEIKKSTNISFIMDEIKKINNQDDFIDIAKNATSDFARDMAVENIDNNPQNIKNQEILKDIAKNDSSMAVRRTAVGRVFDKDILKDIAKNDSDSAVRELANAMIGFADELKKAMESYNQGKCEKLACPKCDKEETIIESGYYKGQYDMFFYKIKCSNCGYSGQFPKNMMRL